MNDRLNGPQCLDGAIGLLRQYATSNEVSQLDEAIRLLDVATGLIPNGHPDLANAYAALVGAYTQRFIRLRNMDDREKARLSVAEGVRRLDSAPAAAPIWSNLASLTRVVYQQTGNLTDLNESIEAARTAARAWVESGTAIHPMTRATLAGSVMTRFALHQHVEDLSETLEYADAAVDAVEPGHPDRLNVLAIVVTAYRLHYEFTGAMRSLTLAVEYHEELREKVPPGHVEEGTYLTTLAMTYLLRYDRLGSMGDIDAALASLDRVVDLADSTERGLVLSNRARALLHRADHLAEAGRLDDALADTHRAIDDADAVLKLTSTQGTGQIHGRHVAANAWAAVARLTGDTTAASRAREHLEAALVSTDPNENVRRTATIALANLHLLNEHTSSTPQQVAEALSRLRRIIATTTEDDPIVRIAVASLIAGLLAHGAKDDEWASELMELLDRLAASGPTSAATVVAAAVDVGAALADHSDNRGADAYDVALRLLPTAVWLGLDRRSQERLLIRLPSIARHAAAAQLTRGAAGILDALRAIEHGRTVLWSQLIQLRNNEPRLAEHLALADALTEVAGAITALNRETAGGIHLKRPPAKT